MAKTATTQTTPAYRDMELVNLDGKLAIYHCGYTDTKQPVTHSFYWVSTIRLENGYCDHILGSTVWSPNGASSGYGQVRTTNGTYTNLDYSHWQYTTVDTPVPMPRDKAENTWEWDSGQWRVKWFPTCPDCRKAHNPDWHDHCDWCGKALPSGTRCAKCKRNHPED